MNTSSIRIAKTLKVTECVCPVCGVIHIKAVESDYLNDTSSWMISGYLCILDDDCRGIISRNRQLVELLHNKK